MPFKDHFQTLRVPHRATSQQIQKAYYERLKFFHPDFFQDDPARRAVAELETKSLNEAYEALATPAARETYLREWERHHNPLRVAPHRAVAAPEDAGGRGAASSFLEQVRELQMQLEQRTRELKAATLGVRQSQDRLQQLSRTVESQQDIARKLESRLIERETEIQELRNLEGAAQAQVRRLESQLADALRRSPQQLGATSASPDLAEQRRLVDEAAHEIRVLRERLRLAEAELRGRPAGAQEVVSGGEAAPVDSGAPEQEVLLSALSERSRQLEQACQMIADLQERLHQRELLERHSASLPPAPEVHGWQAEVGRRVDDAAGWLSPSRATLLLVVLLLALCAVAITLIFLTVSFDLGAIRTGLGRLGL